MAEEQNGLTLVEFYSITEKEFEKLSQKKSNALYFLDTGRLFKGNVEISSKNIIQQFSSLYAFPTPGDESIIYLDKSTNKTYRWTGSVYGVISETIALGETSSTAYRGDRGKIAYDHSQSAHAPSNAQANVIETIKVNGTALTPNSKAVDNNFL